MNRKRFIKKTLLITFVITLIFSSTIVAFAGMNNFSESISYPGFKDVSSNAWYYSDINKSCKLGLFKGYPSGIFSPNGKITLAEAIKVAAVIRATYDGDILPTNCTVGKWYDNYVSYAKAKEIIKDNDFSAYGGAAKRNEIAYIFSNALPLSEYKKINNVTELPDVTSSIKYSSNILVLYNAGILRGDDEYGTFRPTDNIKRAEVATIINRIALNNIRVKFTLLVKNETPSQGGVMSEVQAVSYIRNFINNAPEDAWLGRVLYDKERQILENIKEDPKNCYPEFNSVGNFNYTMQGYALSFYLNFITNVLMCGGDINNYNDGQY